MSLLLPGIDYPGFNWMLSSCGVQGQNQIILGNPPVNLPEPDMFITQQLEAIDMVAMPLPLVNAYSLRNIAEPCELPANPTVFIFHGEKYYRCASRALSPLPLIFSYRSEKSLCGTGTSRGASWSKTPLIRRTWRNASSTSVIRNSFRHLPQRFAQRHGRRSPTPVAACARALVRSRSGLKET